MNAFIFFIFYLCCIFFVEILFNCCDFEKHCFKNYYFRMFPPSRLRGPLMEDYRHLINTNQIRKPSLPKTSLRKWLVAGTATAAIYVLSRYMFTTASY